MKRTIRIEFDTDTTKEALHNQKIVERLLCTLGQDILEPILGGFSEDIRVEALYS